MLDGVQAAPAWVGRALHDLAQPLTALECRLFVATMAGPAGEATTEDELRAAIADGLRECARLMDGVRAMQQRLVDAEGEA